MSIAAARPAGVMPGNAPGATGSTERTPDVRSTRSTACTFVAANEGSVTWIRFSRSAAVTGCASACIDRFTRSI